MNLAPPPLLLQTHTHTRVVETVKHVTLYDAAVERGRGLVGGRVVIKGAWSEMHVGTCSPVVGLCPPPPSDPDSVPDYFQPQS